MGSGATRKGVKGAEASQLLRRFNPNIQGLKRVLDYFTLGTFSPLGYFVINPL